MVQCVHVSRGYEGGVAALCVNFSGVVDVTSVCASHDEGGVASVRF